MKMFTKNSAKHVKDFSLFNRWLSFGLVLIMLLGTSNSMAQFGIAATATNYTQDFNTLVNTGAGTWTNNSTLTGWYARTDNTASITVCNANTGTTTTANLYSYGTNLVSERALGWAPSNAFTGASAVGKGYVGWRLVNNTGSAIASITLTWTGEQWRKDNTVNQSLVVSYQQAATVTALTGGTWTAAGSTFVSPIITTGASALDGNAAANRVAGISVVITVNIPAGEEIMIRWEDLNDSGNDHQLAIDDVTINATAAATAPTVFTFPLANIILSNQATFLGDVVSDNGSAITDRGFVFAATATNNNPEIGGTGVTQQSEPGTTGIYSISPFLSVNTEFSFKAYAINAGGTSYGALASTFFTLANTPSAPTVGSPTSGSLAVSLNATDGNPSSTLYAIRVDGSTNYVQADGSIAAGEVWQTIATWSTITVNGLTASTLYSFDVKAKNGANLETGFGTPTGGTTSGAGAQNQTISFGALSDKTYGDANFFLTATATSGLTVTFQSLNTNVATVSGNEVTIVGAGTATIRASQAGDGGVLWNPAPDVDQSFDVDPFTLTVSGAVAQDKVYNGNTDAVITGATLVGVIGMDDVSVSGDGDFDDPNVATNINVTANLVLGGADAGNYLLTQPTGLSADIEQASQTITFNPLPNKTTADLPYALTATSSSGLPVAYSSGTPAVADVSGNTVTIFSAGSTVITATQAGNINYLPATPVPQTQVITQAPSVVTYNFGSSAPGTALPTGGVPVNNLTISAISQGNNNGTTALLTTTSGSTGYAGVSGSYNAGAASFAQPFNTATNTYFEFTLTPANAHKVTLTGISFGSRSTGTGPQAYTIRSSVDGYASDVATGTTLANSTWGLRTPTTTSTEGAFGQAVTFRLFGHSGIGAPSANTANWRVDDISLSLFVDAAPLCEGTPEVGTASAATSSFCGNGSTTVSLTGNTDLNSASGLSVQWYSSINNVDFDPVPLANSTSLATGNLTQTTYYYAVISCSNSGLSETSNTVTVTINEIPAIPTVSTSQPDCITATGSITILTPTGLGLTYSNGGAYQPELLFSTLAPGSYNVTAQSNGCISGLLNVVINDQPFVPGTPGVVSGITNVCPYIGTATQLTYSVAPVPGATGYSWTVPPTVTLVSGQGTASIEVTINAGFIANANKQIRVRSTSVCGNSAERIFYLLAQFPNTPGPITGPTDACPLLGSSAVYSIAAAPGASSYIWNAQPGTTITPAGPGPLGNSVTITFPPTFTTSAITVQSVNDCGTSGIRSITVIRNNPSTPSLISGPTNACAFIAPGGTAATYSVPSVAGVTYTWTAPPGAIGLTGQGTNSISFTYPNGFTNGLVTVFATNGCGVSGTRSLVISKLNPATPGVIDVVNTVPCPNREYTYTIAAMPSNATSILWTASAGTILSGQGTTSITVSYPGTAIDGVVTAQAVNNCGASVIRSTAVKLAICEEAPPPPPFAGTGSQVTGKGIIQAENTSMQVNVYPNPSTTDFKLQVITAGSEEIAVRLLDMAGRFLKQITVMPYQTINIGANLKSGSYMIEVRQGNNVKTTRVLKF